MPPTMMKSQLLLDKLKNLVEIDRTLSFNSQDPQIYRQRALLFQELGCDALAQYDNRICAYLEQKDQEFYNQNYMSMLSVAEFEVRYKAEKDTFYYESFFNILQNEPLFLKEKLDPLLFALRSGNAELLGLFNLALRDCNDAMKYLQSFPQEYAIAALNKAMLLLLVGDYLNGWKLYEKRWETNYKSFKKSDDASTPIVAR